MNKGRRNEIKQLKYKRRIKRLRIPDTLMHQALVNPKGDQYNFTSFKTTSNPCSCGVCQQPEQAYNRGKEKADFWRIVSVFKREAV